jgi:hypothetical protein
MPTVSQRISDFYRNARWRAQRRKSAWNILLFPLCFGGFLVCWYALFQLVWKFHTAIYPEHQFAEFWRPGISMANFILSFLMMFSITPAAVALGFMLGDILIWLIPPARRVSTPKPEDIRARASSNRCAVFRRSALWALPIGFAVALTAAYLLNSLR